MDPRSPISSPELAQPEVSLHTPPAEAREEEPLPLSTLTLVLIGINLVWFGVSVMIGCGMMEADLQPLVSSGANLPALTASTQPWRLVSCMFVHIGLLHLCLNMYCLLSLGSFLEYLFGKAGFLAIYFVSGIGGALASMVWNPATVSAGASGAIFGLVGGILGLMTARSYELPQDFVKKNTTSVLGFIGYNLFFGLTVQGIDNAAHLGGLFFGWLTGMALSRLFRSDRWRPAQYAGLAGMLVLLGGLFYFCAGRVAASGEARGLKMIAQSKRVVVQKSEIYRSGTATAEDTDKLIDFLKKNEFISGSQQISAMFHKDEQGYELFFIAKPEKARDPQVHQMFNALRMMISETVLNNQPLKVHLCNDYFVPLHTIDSSEK